jgi:hypothetical protein
MVFANVSDSHAASDARRALLWPIYSVLLMTRLIF